MKRRLRITKSTPVSVIILFLIITIAQETGWLQRFQEHIENNPPGTYSVTHFADGDTIRVNMNGTEEEIRFIGVDTPETQDPRKPVQCFGKAASVFTRGLIDNNPVRLEADPLNTNRDRYNRLLRYVYLPDGTLVNAEIIKHGYGFAYLSFPVSKADEFREYQKLAREQNKGLWAACEPSPNGYGGYQSNSAE